MDLRQLIEEIRQAPGYRGQIAWLHEVPARPARYADLPAGLYASVRAILEDLGI